jgi:hypothetical protein
MRPAARTSRVRAQPRRGAVPVPTSRRARRGRPKGTAEHRPGDRLQRPRDSDRRRRTRNRRLHPEPRDRRPQHVRLKHHRRAQGHPAQALHLPGQPRLSFRAIMRGRQCAMHRGPEPNPQPIPAAPAPAAVNCGQVTSGQRPRPASPPRRHEARLWRYLVTSEPSARMPAHQPAELPLCQRALVLSRIASSCAARAATTTTRFYRPLTYAWR